MKAWETTAEARPKKKATAAEGIIVMPKKSCKRNQKNRIKDRNPQVVYYYLVITAHSYQDNQEKS